MSNNWAPVQTTAKPNINMQMNGGFAGTLWGKKIGGMIGVNYANAYRFQNNTNNQNGIIGITHIICNVVFDTTRFGHAGCRNNDAWFF